jgi:ubiquinone/menaquinone biosynthesis C-methylase UbiE
MKDNFSKQAHLYAIFRPGYPQQLYDFLTDLAAGKKIAWDCGTGNGQVAAKLSEYFEKVYATDISASQIANAVKKKNIFYSLEKAEKTAFANNQFDLITIAQAIHWFHFEKFYKEVKRTLKQNGVIAVFGYNLIRINKEIDAVIDDFYINITGPYWDKERKFVDENYANIPFPFDKEIKAPEFESEYEWELEHLIGYFNTWSAVQHFITIKNENPVEQIIEPLKKLWGNETKRKVTFPIFMRIGRNEN